MGISTTHFRGCKGNKAHDRRNLSASNYLFFLPKYLYNRGQRKESERVGKNETKE